MLFKVIFLKVSIAKQMIFAFLFFLFQLLKVFICVRGFIVIKIIRRTPFIKRELIFSYPRYFGN